MTPDIAALVEEIDRLEIVRPRERSTTRFEPYAMVGETLLAKLRAALTAGPVLEARKETVHIGTVIHIPDGLGTTFVEWNEERYKLKPGDAVYALSSSGEGQEGKLRAALTTKRHMQRGGSLNAERYRWLRENATQIHFPHKGRGLYIGGNCYEHPEWLDAAIDAAMQETQVLEGTKETVTVPREPTEAMLFAASRQLLPSYMGQLDHQFAYDIVSADDVRTIYKAMLSTVESGESGGK